ncbi:MAG: hypothetical protein C4557_12505 [Anaerolineaceae bacterium]|jgi:uncharacterized membrane protein|nr:MAG: hypothetical protein C4557_12505 [Anaerolineaceae bacterium]
MNAFLLIVLRLVHVASGILWGGAAVFLLFFVKPSVKAIGAAGPQFMQSLVERRRAPLFMLGASVLTVVSGGILYWFSSGGFNAAWIASGPGIGFTIGSAAALIGFLFGAFGIGPTSAQMGALGAQIAASGKGPTPEQAARMEALEKRLNIAERVDFIMLALAILMMATARYWTF